MGKLALLWNSNSNLNELANLKSLKEIELWRINKLSDISFIGELTNLEIIKLQDLKHVTSLPDLSRHPNLQRVFLIDTGINVKELPDYLQEKVSDNDGNIVVDEAHPDWWQDKKNPDRHGIRIPVLDENGNQKVGARNRKQWKRVDHRSYARQGKLEIPTIHEGADSFGQLSNEISNSIISGIVYWLIAAIVMGTLFIIVTSGACGLYRNHMLCERLAGKTRTLLKINGQLKMTLSVL